MRSGNCPGDVELEEYFYNQLPLIRAKLVRYHVTKCSVCQERLESIRQFDQFFTDIPFREPPPALCNRIIDSIQVSETSADSKTVARDQPLPDAPVLPMKIRWAASVALVVLNTLLYWRFGNYVALSESKNYILGWNDIRMFYDLARSGTLRSIFTQIITALKTDGFFSLEIISSVLPGQFLSVIVFSGIATVVLLTHLWVSRNGGRKV